MTLVWSKVTLIMERSDFCLGRSDRIPTGGLEILSLASQTFFHRSEACVLCDIYATDTY